jgi:hypothetical protein
MFRVDKRSPEIRHVPRGAVSVMQGRPIDFREAV